jgi:hypothetical protein
MQMSAFPNQGPAGNRATIGRRARPVDLASGSQRKIFDHGFHR